MGLSGMFGLISVVGCEADPRGEDTAEMLEGVGALMLRWEALLAGASAPGTTREVQQPFVYVS